MIDSDISHPYFVTAADEALAISCSKGSGQNTIHFYRREPPAISLGYFRRIAEDVDLDACETAGIKIVRRISGGGSIYTDKNQLIMGIISNVALGSDVGESFRRTCNVLITALAKCGISATFKEPNDILVNGRKVSGSAQVKKKNIYITHCTIILDLDFNIINRVLKQKKPSYVSSIKTECGFQPKIKVLKSEILNAFQHKFGCAFESKDFTDEERRLIQKLIDTKYSTPTWNFKR